MSRFLRPSRGCAIALAGALTTLASVPAQADDLEPVVSVEGITEYRLDNGLRVLLFPDPSTSTVTVNVTYMVGSRHEGRGEKGMAHLLEHMLFKGTNTFENIWGALEDHGASFNGTTWVDRTNYYETLPATPENLEFALHMEADRMVNSRVSAEDLATEMTVVRNEFEMGENNPVGKLMERMVSSAYLWHNYGLSTIGNRSDIERVPIENLRAFYRRYYQPDNAVLVVAGKFDAAPALELIQTHFGAIPRPERVLDATYTEEPVQDGARFVELERVGSTQACGAVYHICAGSHPDAPALQVLADVLTSQPSGHLYEALVDGELAFSVNGFIFPTAEPGVVILLASSRVDQDVRACHDKLLEVAEQVADGITDEEVERSRTRLLNQIKLSLANSGRIGIQLSEFQAMGDWRMFFVNRDRLKEITTDDVRRVARTYLMSSNRTSGIFTPVDEPARAEIPSTPDVEAIVSDYRGSETIAQGETFEPTPENVEARTQRMRLSDHVQVALLPKETRGDKVIASFAFHYGTEADLTGNTDALGFLPLLMMKGTAELDEQALRDAINELQSQINVGGDAGTIVGSIVSDRANLVAAIELLAEIMQSPRLPAEEFEELQTQQVAQLENGLTDPMMKGMIALTRALSPFEPTSIHYVPTIEEQIERTSAVTRDQVAELYERLVGGSYGEIGIVGDFDPAEIEGVLRAQFGSWTSPVPYERVARPYRPVQEMEQVIDTPDKQMAMIATGTVFSMNDADPDYPVLEFANYILGQSAKSRLLNRLRHQGGLSYSAGSQLQADAQDDVAMLVGFAICAPQNATKAQTAMNEELERWIDSGITEEELVEGKQGFRAQFDTMMANDQFIAGQLREMLKIGRTFMYHRGMLDTIEGLSTDDIAEVLKSRLSSLPMVQLQAGDQAAAAEGAEEGSDGDG